MMGQNPDEIVVVIGVEGGLVCGASANRHNVRVLIRDYDVEGADEDSIIRSAEGDYCPGEHICFAPGLTPETIRETDAHWAKMKAAS
jgi:hypothetical protein